MIGVLALQGGFASHCRTLASLGVAAREIRKAEDLDLLDGLILPGGESTSMLKLLGAFDLFEPLNAFARSGRPVLGTCAGAILMSERVNFKNQRSLGWIPVSIRRNAYGTQRESFFTQVDCPLWNLSQVEAFFIRAPSFQKLGKGVEVLSRFNGDITGVVYQNLTAITYHPELSSDPRFHQAWLRRFVTRSEAACV